MTTTTTSKSVEEVCIDLPGEAVQCSGKSDSYKVILRKHRDVIFDINHGDGKTYTVEATDSDFYNARDKKLIFAVRKGTVTFKDGERLPLRVSRGFKGALLLKSGDQILMRVEPNELDRHQHGNDPKEKPAPIIVTLGSSKAAPTIKTSLTPTLDWANSLSANTPAGSTTAQQQIMQIVEVKKTSVDTPKEIADFFTHGGEETAIDANGILTRNWLWAQIAGGVAYYSDNKHWVKELWGSKFYLKKIVHKNAGPKWYIVFKSPPGLRDFLTAAKYATANEKVLAISMGAGSAAGMRHAAWDSAKGALKKAGLVAIVFTIALDVAEWYADYAEIDPKTGKHKKDFADLFAKVGMDLTYAVAGAALATVGMALTVLFAGFAGITIGGAFIVIGTIVASIYIGFKLAGFDKDNDITNKLAKKLREATDYLNEKQPNDYAGYGDVVNSEFATGQ